MSPHRGSRSIALWALAGFILGAAIASTPDLPELFRRLQVASTGGGGESADWGEPVVYMLIWCLQAGVFGALTAGVTAFLVQKRTSPES